MTVFDQLTLQPVHLFHFRNQILIITGRPRFLFLIREIRKCSFVISVQQDLSYGKSDKINLPRPLLL